MKNIILGLTLILCAQTAMAKVAGCEGKYQGKKISLLAKGSMNDTEDGVGYVKINGRQVAQFDGESAYISYVSRTFSIKNQRGDYVKGKLHNVMTGAATLTKLTLPGEGIDVQNIPVKCWIKN